MLSLVWWLVAVSFHSPNLPFFSYLTREVGNSPHDVVVDENSLSKTKARRCKGWWFMLTCCLSVGAASHVISHQPFVSLFFFTWLSCYPYQPTTILINQWYIIYIYIHITSISLSTNKNPSWNVATARCSYVLHDWQVTTQTSKKHFLGGSFAQFSGPSGWLRTTKNFRYPKWRVSWTLFKAILGVGFPYISRIHRAYIGEDSSILGTTSIFGERIFHNFSNLLKKMYGWPRHARPWECKESSLFFFPHLKLMPVAWKRSNWTCSAGVDWGCKLSKAKLVSRTPKWQGFLQ